MKEEIGLIVCPTDGKENLRNSEASVIELKDGSLLLAYTRFRGGSSSDFAPADIVGKRSSDGGKTWTEPEVIVRGQETPEGYEMNSHVLEACFLRLGNGSIALFYGRSLYRKGSKYHHGNMDDASSLTLHQMMRISDDEGQSWSEERDITLPGEHCQFHLNDSAVRLSTGRLILPNYHGLSLYSPVPEYVQPLLSDDDGKSWFLSDFRLCHDNAAGGLSESSVVERSDGSLLMVSRTMEGFVYHCESGDGGRSWTKPVTTDLASSQTPTSLLRLPDSDDLLLLWNQVSKKEARCGFPRHRLTAAVSSDGGYSWKHRRNLESLDEKTYVDPKEGGRVNQEERITAREAQMAQLGELGLRDSGFCMAEYPSLLIAGGKAVITYDVVPIHPGAETPSGCSLKLRVLPLSWFYEFD